MTVWLFLPRDATLAWHMLWPCVRPSVRPSIRLSQAGIVSKPLNGSSWVFWHRGYSSLFYIVLEGNWGTSKTRVLPSRILSQTLMNVATLLPRHVYRHKCYQLNSTICPQFITLSADICVQHDERDQARRAGSFATAETCSWIRFYHARQRCCKMRCTPYDFDTFTCPFVRHTGDIVRTAEHA